MRQPVQVAVYCARLTPDGWKYLLLHRAVGRGVFWQGVTGGVEDDEAFRRAALRELHEETGYTPASLEQLDYSFTFPPDPKWRHLYDDSVDTITEIVFLALIDTPDDPVPDPTEHDEWRWCSYEEALEALTWPGNRESLKHCERRLRSRYNSDA